MPFDQNLLDAMPDTITVEPFLGRDTDGNPTYGPPSSVRANVTRRKDRGGPPGTPENVKGEDPSPSGVAIIAPMPDIGPHARITLTNGDFGFVTDTETFGDPDVPGDDYIQQVDYRIER